MNKLKLANNWEGGNSKALSYTSRKLPQGRWEIEKQWSSRHDFWFSHIRVPEASCGGP